MLFSVLQLRLFQQFLLDRAQLLLRFTDDGCSLSLVESLQFECKALKFMKELKFMQPTCLSYKIGRFKFIHYILQAPPNIHVNAQRLSTLQTVSYQLGFAFNTSTISPIFDCLIELILDQPATSNLFLRLILQLARYLSFMSSVRQWKVETKAIVSSYGKLFSLPSLEFQFAFGFSEFQRGCSQIWLEPRR